MTRPLAVGVLLVALGLIYALLYAAWVRKQRRHRSAAVVAAGRAARGDAVLGAHEASSDRESLRTVAAEGTYVSTTTSASRHERVVVDGLGNRSRATMAVRRASRDELVSYDREGEQRVVIPAGRVVDVRRERGMAGKFVGSPRLLVVQWRADDDEIYETGFLPRYRADLERIETALWWHRGGGDVRDIVDHSPDSQTSLQAEPVEGPPQTPRTAPETTEGTTS